MHAFVIRAATGEGCTVKLEPAPWASTLGGLTCPITAAELSEAFFEPFSHLWVTGGIPTEAYQGGPSPYLQKIKSVPPAPYTKASPSDLGGSLDPASGAASLVSCAVSSMIAFAVLKYFFAQPLTAHCLQCFAMHVCDPKCKLISARRAPDSFYLITFDIVGASASNSPHPHKEAAIDVVGESDPACTVPKFSSTLRDAGKSNLYWR